MLNNDLYFRFAMQIINGAGHNPHQEQPNVVNKHITKFIKGKTTISSSEARTNQSM